MDKLKKATEELEENFRLRQAARERLSRLKTKQPLDPNNPRPGVYLKQLAEAQDERKERNRDYFEAEQRSEQERPQSKWILNSSA